MRLLYNMIIIAFMVFVFAMVIMVVSYAIDSMHQAVKETLENASVSLNNTVDIDKVDVYSNTPGVDILNYILIISIIIAIVGVFMYSRNR